MSVKDTTSDTSVLEAVLKVAQECKPFDPFTADAREKFITPEQKEQIRNLLKRYGGGASYAWIPFGPMVGADESMPLSQIHTVLERIRQEYVETSEVLFVTPYASAREMLTLAIEHIAVVGPWLSTRY